VRSCRTPGSVRGVLGNWHPYRDLQKISWNHLAVFSIWHETYHGILAILTKPVADHPQERTR
jgi:hypothetical protein